VLYFSFFKNTDQPFNNGLSIGLSLGQNYLFFFATNDRCSERSGNLLEYGNDDDLSLIYFCLLGEYSYCAFKTFALLYFAKSKSCKEVCQCQQYGGNSLSGHDGNITWPSQVLE